MKIHFLALIVILAYSSLSYNTVLRDVHSLSYGVEQWKHCHVPLRLEGRKKESLTDSAVMTVEVASLCYLSAALEAGAHCVCEVGQSLLEQH